MAKDFGRRKDTKGAERRWNVNRMVYTCVDRADVPVGNRIFKRARQKSEGSSASSDGSESDWLQRQKLPRNGVSYETCRTNDGSPRLLISKIEYDRDLSRIARATKNARTIIFPHTIREAACGAFGDTSLRSAVLNEGLEVLGVCRRAYNYWNSGVFRRTLVKHITLPSTLRVLGDGTFYDC